MAITLGDLRTFCQEVASPDSAGASADREFMIWINNGLRRLYAELDWDKILHQQKLNILPVETGDNLQVTQDSRALVLSGGETFKDKYVDDRWHLIIDGEDTQVFELASIDDSPTNQNATMRDGDEWILASASGKSYEFIKTIYSLPDNADAVDRVQILATGLHVVVLEPNAFDHERSFNPTQTGQYPRFATFRAGNLEIWPHPGSTRVKLGLTYRKSASSYTTASDDSTEVLWEEKWRDLLEKAIQLEAAIYQGDNSPVTYPVAKLELETSLGRYKSLNNRKRDLAGPMQLRLPRSRGAWPPESFSWVGDLEDV